MFDIWSFLLQTLTVSGVAALILLIKALFKDKLTPKVAICRMECSWYHYASSRGDVWKIYIIPLADTYRNYEVVLWRIQLHKGFVPDSDNFFDTSYSV